MVLLVIGLLIYSISIVLMSIIVVKGPTLSDRVLSADIILYTSSISLAILGVIINSRALAVCTIILVLWAYALDIYYAKYIESGELGE